MRTQAPQAPQEQPVTLACQPGALVEVTWRDPQGRPHRQQVALTYLARISGLSEPLLRRLDRGEVPRPMALLLCQRLHAALQREGQAA